jgi:uncharacterized delta-60 repeat protein
MKQLLLICVFTFGVFNLFGQSGTFDKTFGVGGKVITSFKGNDYGRSLCLQSTGKILVAGYTDSSGFQNCVITRYNVNGSLDNTFGIGGKLTTTIVPNYWGTPMAVQGDDKIIIAGLLGNDILVGRYTANGKLDNTFGTSGFASGKLDINYTHVARAIVLQVDGKIIVTSSGYNNFSGRKFEMVRFGADGTLDNAFGNMSKVVTNFGSYTDVVTSMVIQQDGKIILAGYVDNGANGNDFAIARYNANGTLDTKFGVGGKVLTDFYDNEDIAICISLQTNGKLVLAGYAQISSVKVLALARYSTNGFLDSSFGINGKVVNDTANIKFETARAILIQKDGKIVISGGTKGAKDWDFLLARFHIDGTVDNSFGTAGRVVFDIGEDDLANAIAIQNDNKIIIAGYTGTSTNHKITLVRFDNSITNVKSNVAYNSHYSLIPNPSTGVFNIISSNNMATIQTVEIYNAIGEMVIVNSQLNTNCIDISNSPNGIYFARIIYGEESCLFKLMKE